MDDDENLLPCLLSWLCAPRGRLRDARRALLRLLLLLLLLLLRLRLTALRRAAGLYRQILDERETNARLEPFTSDVAALRRHLVDAELLERTRSGSEYALVTSDL